MPEPRKKNRTRKSTAKVSDINETKGTDPQPPTPAAEEALVEHAEFPAEPVREEPVASSEVESTTAPTVGIYHENGKVESLLRDNDFMKQIVEAMTQSKVMDTLAEDIADKLKDALGSNPEFRQRLVNAVVSTETFRRKLVGTMTRHSG